MTKRRRALLPSLLAGVWAFFMLFAGSPLALPGELTPQLEWHPALHGAEFFVSLYEEVGDLDDTPALQRALDACRAAGGGTVVLHNRAYFVSSTLEIGFDGAGQTGGISFVGQGYAVSSVTNASILVDTGSASHGPLLRIHNAHSVRVAGMGFDGNNKATSCVHLEHDQTDTSPASWPTEHVDFQACTFMGARNYNAQINDSTTAGMIWGDVSLVSWHNCYFRPSPTAAATQAHIFQRSPNALSNSCHGVQFFGDGTYPERAVQMESGSMGFHTCQSVLLGDVDIKMVTPANDIPPNINVFGWESQSKHFLEYDASGSTANALRPSVLSGVTHADITSTGTFSIKWTVAAGSHGTLNMMGVVVQYDIELNGSALNPFAAGVKTIDPGTGIIGTAAGNVQGFWTNGSGEKQFGLGDGRVIVVADTDGSHWPVKIELDDATASSNSRGAGIVFSENRTGRHVLAGVEGFRRNSNADYLGGLKFYTQQGGFSSSESSLTLAATIDGAGRVLAVGGIGVGNSAAATTPGSVVKKIEVFDANGTSLGFIPVYSSIT